MDCLKGTLTILEEKINTEKTCNRQLIYKVEMLSKERNPYPDDYSSNFEDILARIKNDLETNDQLLIQLGDIISDHFGLLDRKQLFPAEDLSDLEKRLEDTHDKVKEKEKELANFQDELYSIPSEKNPYNEYGYSLNPFSLSGTIGETDGYNKPKIS